MLDVKLVLTKIVLASSSEGMSIIDKPKSFLAKCQLKQVKGKGPGLVIDINGAPHQPSIHPPTYNFYVLFMKDGRRLMIHKLKE